MPPFEGVVPGVAAEVGLAELPVVVSSALSEPQAVSERASTAPAMMVVVLVKDFPVVSMAQTLPNRPLVPRVVAR